MHKVERVSALRAAVSSARKDKKNVAFVPTMGNLHEGHLELVRVAKRHADFVVVSIYVNPTQFGQNEDLDNYPTTPEEDARLLAEAGADLLFLPRHETMYPGALDEQTIVQVPIIGKQHCGIDRPDHFQGVTTIVSRLFNMVQPDVAVFGKKDYQQLTIIQRMVNDLAFAIKVVGVDTVRDDNGLALSSRNNYLTKVELAKANSLYKELQALALGLQSGKETIATLEKQACDNLLKAGFEPNYITVCRRTDLQAAIPNDKQLVILAAARIGSARLIDNLEVTLK